MTDVAAALIEENGKIMICQRPKNKTRAMQWEFVGGKVENGETKAQALVRECMEEIGVTVEVGEEFMEVYHTYPDIDICLTLFKCKIVGGRPQKLEHNDIKWITRDQLDLFEFCPADKDILETLKNETNP